MKGLIALIVAGLVAITAYTLWAERHKADRRSRLEERAVAQSRDTLSKGKAADSARRETDRVLPTAERVRVVRELIRDTLFLPNLPDHVGVRRSTLEAVDSTLQAVTFANMLLKEERAAQDGRARSLADLAATNRALYLNERRRNFMRRGFYAGIGVVYTPDRRVVPGVQVGYGFSVKF